LRRALRCSALDGGGLASRRARQIAEPEFHFEFIEAELLD
jgi:hypothetical protein